MQLILHRSDVTGHNGETEESLAPAFDATEIWQILYKRNSAGWADVLTTRLTAPEAHAFADRLRRHVREKSKRGLFRDHRRVYSRADGARLALLIGWLARAGAAGCVVWSDLSAAIDAPIAAVSPAAIDLPPEPASTHPTIARTRANAHAVTRIDEDLGDDPTMPADTTEGRGVRGVMPEWMPEELKDTAWGRGQ